MQDEFGPHSTDAIWAAARVAEAYVQRLQRGEGDGELRGERESGIWRNPAFVDQQLLVFWRTLQYLRRSDRNRQLAADITHNALHYQYLQDDDDFDANIDNPHGYARAHGYAHVGAGPGLGPGAWARARPRAHVNAPAPGPAPVRPAHDDTDDDDDDSDDDDDNNPPAADTLSDSDTESESVYYDADLYVDDTDNADNAADAAAADANAGGH